MSPILLVLSNLCPSIVISHANICSLAVFLLRFIGEAEKKVRDLFAPAEQEYKESGDDSALHIIILDVRLENVVTRLFRS
jgi:hypothetical protein